MRALFHLHVIHDERLIVPSLLLPRSVFLRVSLRRLLFRFHNLHSDLVLKCEGNNNHCLLYWIKELCIALADDIRELGNVELFELCETIPKVQCSQCLLYWNQGIIYCTCGQFLVESESRRKVHKLRLDALSLSRTT